MSPNATKVNENVVSVESFSSDFHPSADPIYFQGVCLQATFIVKASSLSSVDKYVQLDAANTLAGATLWSAQTGSFAWPPVLLLEHLQRQRRETGTLTRLFTHFGGISRLLHLFCKAFILKEKSQVLRPWPVRLQTLDSLISINLCRSRPPTLRFWRLRNGSR